jgi:maltose alpha-D-glucosyltransferase/alpha-amylase
MPGLTENIPFWYKDAIIYEVHVRSFFDSNGDGIGDFRGLLQKVPYLRDLGVTAVWILPFYVSPLRDDGYDIADYFRINPQYGTLRDFHDFLREAHARGIRVITELVLNHTSDQHAWFQRARRAKPGSPWRDYYVWSDSQDKFRDARIIFRDFERSNWTWDPVANAYYWHRFYSHQPDLNFDNPRVHQDVIRALDFWFDMGVDGLRLDAVPYLYEREGTNCENLPETYAFIKKLRAHMDGKYPNRLLLAEANQWPEDAAAYFGKGDLCQMVFHFPLMTRMFMALQMEDRFPMIDILEQTPKIPDNCQWGLFLRNHDELTLEMVTDEERDYMYRVYARDPLARINLGIRRRLAPLMGNDRRKIELMNVLLFTLPGTPIIYYGDEIGMGDNYYLGDRNGVRTPMQWSPDRNAGFSLSNPQKLFLPVIIDPEYHYEAVCVETQSHTPSSLLWWMRRMIDLRKRFSAFGRGSFEFVSPDNPKVLSFLRSYGDETILVLINLSRFSQAVEISTPRFAGFTPEDLFSRNRFPVIKESPYVIILGRYDYQLLLMKKEAETITLKEEVVVPEILVENRWVNVLEGIPLKRLAETVLPEYLRKCRWFGGKGRAINTVTVTDSIPFTGDDETYVLLLIEVAYAEEGTEAVILPIHFAVQDSALQLLKESPEAVIARLRVDEVEGILYDAVYSGRLREALFRMVAQSRRTRVRGGELAGRRTRLFTRLLAGGPPPADSQILRSEQGNTSILFDNRYLFKLFRRAEEGIRPEEEMMRFLTETVHFEGIAPFVGALEYRRPGAGPVTLALVHRYLPGHSDAWKFALDEVTRYFDLVLTQNNDTKKGMQLPPSPIDADPAAIPPILLDMIGSFCLEMVRLLGQRCGELHLALASRPEVPGFSPEPFSFLDQRSIYQSMRSLARKVLIRLKRNLGRLAPEIRSEAEWVLAAEPEILQQHRRFLDRRFSAMKIRIHGDYHLGQVLFTGKDFILIDFERKTAQAMSERRIKRSPLQDVAGMVRSFHYAAHAALIQHAPLRAEDVPYLEPWAEAWYRCCVGVFIHSYLQTVAGAPFMPKEQEEVEAMLSAFVLDRALHELGYELENRPEWVMIPLRGIRRILESGHSGSLTVRRGL